MKKQIWSIFGLAAFVIAPLFALAEEITLPRPDPTIAEFARGVKFTVDGYTGTEVLTNFPVLVRLKEYNEGTGEGIQGFHYTDFTRADYKDLCFVDMQTNGLPCEVDTWNASGESLVWVTLPRVTNGTEFVMWYHSSSLGSLVCNKTAWGDYAGVWHMNDPGDGAVTVADATTNNLHATATSGSFAQSNGRIGGARIPTKTGSDKNTERIEVNLDTNAKKAVVNGVNTDADHAFTVSMWVKPVKYSSFDGPNSAYLMSRKTQDQSSAYWAVQFNYDNDNKRSIDYSWLRVWRNEGADSAVWRPDFVDSIIPSSASDCYGNWYKFDVVYSNKSVDFYVNGGGTSDSHLSNTSSTAFPANGSNKLFLTGTSVNGKARPFRGDLDEFRLRAGAMSADWVKADFDTVDNTSFLLSGSVQSVKVKEIPVASFSLIDSGAAFATFSGVISSLGEEEATSGNVYYKVWQSSDPEPTSPDDGWTLLRSELAANVAFTESVTGLTPGTPYSWKLYAKNNLGDETEEISEGSFTTSGAGVPGVGGETYRVNDDYVHRFTVDSDTTTFEFTPPSYISALRALVVAGGGPGGYDRGGGGGAGGLVYNSALELSGGTTYTINVGTGGVASVSSTVYGSNGGDSAITNKATGTEVLIVRGGGAGGNYGTTNKRGVSGGSGGGSAYGSSGGAAVAGQGFAGGTGKPHDNFENGGGGGGAAEIGGDATSQGATHSAGGGGAGFYTDISGVYAYYAGGGGGGADVPEKSKVSGNGPGRGGDGGGGNGGSSTVAATAGQTNFGGGGGGGYIGFPGGNGGSGVVIFRYAVQGSGQGMAEPAIALESLSRVDDPDDPNYGLTTVGYRVAWAGENDDYANVKIAWGLSKDNLSTTNDIGSSMIGRGTGTFMLPDQTKTVYVRALAVNDGGYVGISPEVKTLVFENPAAPVGTVAVTPGITKAALEANVESIGEGASSVGCVFQIAPNDEFAAGNYSEFPATNGTVAAGGTLYGAATGLLANMYYYVRAVLTNDIEEVFVTDPVSFRTDIPWYPWGTFSPSDEEPEVTTTKTSLTATGIYRNFGEGASSGFFWMQVATTKNFAAADIVAETEHVAVDTIPTSATFTAEGLEPDTVYYVRLRLSSDWRTGSAPGDNKGLGPFRTKADKTGVMFLIY